jgi:N-acetyl-1-D-myo-inositol-2-amino-2-deoxy-alpha-D-glucopyranoside deacetylase
VTDRRLLLVHAHPDDETIGTGATMARYAADGVQVSLVTCTLGEFGEILVPELAELEAGRGDQLGGYRMGELASALHALGVTDHRFLGGAGRFHDSGMMGTASNEHPRAFWRAATDHGVFDEAVRILAGIIREVRPQVVVTYDPNGGYGHPDHIMAHRVTTAAVAAAADAGFGPGEPWAVAKFYWTVTSLAAVRTGLAQLRAAGSAFADHEAEEFPGATEEGITTAVDAAAFVKEKAVAMRAHATQITVDEPFYALSNNLGMKIDGIEYFRLVRGEPGGAVDDAGRETDLFGGISP